MPDTAPDVAPATDACVDLLVVGGGINGAGIARDAAGRGLSVLLCEQGDLAGATSSASTKLIHGGLRYLEYYEFRLVREALQEREVLLRAAPHIIRPQRFILPHDPGMRPAWLVRLGLFLYDHLGRRERLPGSSGVDLRRDPAGAPLRPGITRGFAYSDCWVEDSRLVVLAAIDARERGARILTRTRLERAGREGDGWRAHLRSMTDGTPLTVQARALVNAAGPWVEEVDRIRLGHAAAKTVRLVKGSHIVVPRLFDGDHAYIVQNDDRRIVFAIPYEGAFTLIGTTDVDYAGDPAEAAIDDGEIAYLCRAVSRWFARPVTPADVVWNYSGVRPLFDDHSHGSAAAATRDYVLDLDTAGGVPLLSVFGGKITTFRRLAEEAVDRLCGPLGCRAGAWTAGAPLPGGDMAGAEFAPFLAHARTRWPWLPDGLCGRLAHAYGTRMERIIGTATRLDGLGADLGGGVTEAELEYSVDQEFTRTGDDFLWRRSKLGLHLDAAGRGAVAAWFARKTGGDGAHGCIPPRLVTSTDS